MYVCIIKEWVDLYADVSTYTERQVDRSKDRIAESWNDNWWDQQDNKLYTIEILGICAIGMAASFSIVM